MTRDLYKPLVWLMWLGLPVTALDYWRVWNQLPARMAVHFDANWQPNGFTSREGAVMLGLGIMGVMLIVFTIGSLISRALKPGGSWMLLVVFYLALGFLWYGNYSIIKFNLNAGRAQYGSLILPAQAGARMPMHEMTSRKSRSLEGRRYVRNVTHG
jgi:hypothetical protein